MLKVYVSSMSVIFFWNTKVGKDVICNIKEKIRQFTPTLIENTWLSILTLGNALNLFQAIFPKRIKKYFFLNQDTALNLA